MTKQNILDQWWGQGRKLEQGDSPWPGVGHRKQLDYLQGKATEKLKHFQ